MKKSIVRILFLLSFYFFIGCSDDGVIIPIQNDTSSGTPSANRPSVPQGVGEINVGGKIWMTRNLNVSRYRNGDLIPQVQSGSQWGMTNYCNTPYFLDQLV